MNSDDHPTCAELPEKRRQFVSGMFLLLAGVLSGILTWPLVYISQEFFAAPNLPQELMKLADDDPRVSAGLRKTQRSADLKNTALGMGMFGALTGAMFGCCAGAVRSARSRLVSGFSVGAAIGGIAGVCAGLTKVMIRSIFLEYSTVDSTIVGILIHALGWAIVGVGLGAAVLISSGRQRGRASILVAASGGGVVAGALFPVISAIAFPVNHADVPLPTGSLNTLLFTASAAVLMGLVLNREQRRSTRSDVAAAEPLSN